MLLDQYLKHQHWALYRLFLVLYQQPVEGFFHDVNCWIYFFGDVVLAVGIRWPEQESVNSSGQLVLLLQQ